MSNGSWVERILVLAALVLYWFMATTVSPRIGPTADEPMHLTGGYSYWKFNDYRMQPENGTLAMRWASLPLLLTQPEFPPASLPGWENSVSSQVARAFFFEHGNPTERMLLFGRMMIALFGAAAVWMVYRWARSLWGRAAGLTALVLAVFSPTMLAHGGLVTSDMALTACMIAAISLYWRLLHRISWPRLCAAGIITGATFLAKMSGVLLLPIFAAMLGLRLLRRTNLPVAIKGLYTLRTRSSIGVGSLAATAFVAVTSIFVIWAGYGFRYSLFAPEKPGKLHFSWDVLLEKQPLAREATGSQVDGSTRPVKAPQPTFVTKTIDFAREHRLLPEAYLWGFAHTYKFSRARAAYFLGENGEHGWKLFFPTAVLLKSTPTTLLLFACGVFAVARMTSSSGRFRRRMYCAAPLIVLFIIYWVVAINTRLNIGHRHVLPIYPVLFVFAGAAATLTRLTPSRLAPLALGISLVVHALDSLLVRPFYVSYFQPLVGGINRGHRYLVDSSYDWGQGMPELERWLERKRASGDRSRVFLSYFGADSPRARGLPVIRFGDEVTDHGPRIFPAHLSGGWYVISATYFRGVYLGLPGPWNAEREALYRGIQRELGGAMATTEPRSTEQQTQLLRHAKDWELLQFSRLCYFLRDRDPTEVVGGSLLVFRLTDAEVGQALHGPVEPATGQ